MVENISEEGLQREAKESILSRFNLKIINNYFPEFEEEIRRD